MSEEIQQAPSRTKSFLQRFKLRDVQATFDSIKRTVSHRSSRRDPSPEPSAEEDSLPPYKELYIQKKAAENALNELHEGYFEQGFDPIEFELRNLEDNFGQAEVDDSVDQLTAVLEVVSLQLSHRVLEKNTEFVEGIDTVASIESDLQVSLHSQNSESVDFS